jgi:hypothetical protein
MMNEARNKIFDGSFGNWKKNAVEQFKQRL